MHWVVPLVAVACAASLVAALAMGWDKRQARRRAHRLSEASLAALALLGGWLGLVAGGIAFRHKTRSRRFHAKTAAAALLHLAVVAGLLWAAG